MSQKDFIDQALAIPDGYTNPLDNLSAIDISIDDVNTLVYNSTLNEQQQRPVLVATAVLKGSLHYWRIVTQSGEHPWTRYAVELGQDLATIDWGQVAKEDAKGAAGGLVSALAKGLISNTLSLSLMVIGVVAVGAGASAKDVVGQILSS
ncbi:MAG: hypothetical protein M3Q97_04790 [Bacteroidota bacterium]|nr:hypothetical protein [Bacteroidota bacterium]